MKITAKVKTKLKTVRKKAAKFWKNKKNRKIVIFLGVAVVLFWIIKSKGIVKTTTTTNNGNSGTKTDDGGGVVPPTEIITGDVIPVIMSKGLPEGMDIRITGSSKDWRITDISNPNRPAGMEVSYKVAGKMYRNIQLSNFVWQSNNPLYIQKNWIKIGAADTGPRGNGQGGDDSLSDYIGRSSYAYTNIGFVYK